MQNNKNMEQTLKLHTHNYKIIVSKINIRQLYKMSFSFSSSTFCVRYIEFKAIFGAQMTALFSNIIHKS